MEKIPKYLTKEILKSLTPQEEKAISLHLEKMWEKITHKVPGWRFSHVQWIDLSKINTKDKLGQVINTIRIGGTGENKLEGPIQKGWDTDEPLIAVWVGEITDCDLLDAFNRLRELLKQGYTRLPVAFYVRTNATQWQPTWEDAVEDFRAVANKDKGQKPITRDEIIKLVEERFEKKISMHVNYDAWDVLKTDMAAYLGNLGLNLTPEQINGIITVCVRTFKRRGNVEFYDRKDAEDYLTKYQKVWNDTFEREGDDDLDFTSIDAFLVNTKDSTRSLRLWKQIMEHFVEYGEDAPIVSFDSGATSHKEIDVNLRQTLDEIESLQKLTLKFSASYHYHKDVDFAPTWKIIGSIPQKIKKNTKRIFNKFKGLVDPFV